MQQSVYTAAYHLKAVNSEDRNKERVTCGSANDNLRVLKHLSLAGRPISTEIRLESMMLHSLATFVYLSTHPLAMAKFARCMAPGPGMMIITDMLHFPG